MTAGVLTDKTRLGDFSQKKTRSVAAARVSHDMVDGTHFNELFILPPDALIVDASMVVKVPGEANLTVDMGTDTNEDAFLDEVAADSAAGTVKSMPMTIASLTLTEGTPNTLSAGTVTKSPRMDTGTGLAIGVSFSEQPTAGEWVFIVEYVEYDLTNGQLTNLGTGPGVTTV